jgi:hypothetical protein
MTRLIAWLADKAFDWLDKHQPEKMKRLIQSHVEKIVPEVALRTSMAYLNKQGILHCAACPQRHGLHRAMINKREVYLCDKHYSQWQSQQMAEAHH